MIDAALKRQVQLLTLDAQLRSFGVRDGSQTQAMIRHGYLLAIEEIEKAIADLASRDED